MAGIGDTLTEDIGPLPTWAWAGLGTLAVAGILIYRKKQSMNAAAATSTNQASGTSSNLGTVPISNLSVAAQPMPTSTGPTFVNVSNTTPPPPSNPVNTGNPPAGTLPSTTPTTGGTPNPVRNPYPIGTQVAPGESVVSTAPDPSGKGGWDLTNLGGVYTYGDAPFLGAAYKKAGYTFTNAKIVQIPGGYQINTSKGPLKFTSSTNKAA